MLGQFNLLHPASGNEVDFMVSGDSHWARDQLDPCTVAPLLPDRLIRVASQEDVILGKLLYYHEDGSEKHLRDTTGILLTKAVEIDYEFLGDNARILGVEAEWQSIFQRLVEGDA